jgi:hypothetical protein
MLGKMQTKDGTANRDARLLPLNPEHFLRLSLMTLAGRLHLSKLLQLHLRQAKAM